LPLRASDVELFARALAGKVIDVTVRPGQSALANPAPPAGSEKWLEAVAKDLLRHQGRCLVVAGEHQPAAVHALAHAINAALGNVGKTLYYTEIGRASCRERV